MARIPQYKDGEFIELNWEYGDPDAYYVRGHVDEPTFRAALIPYHGDGFFYGDPPELELRHAFAFWALEGNDGYGNPGRILRECARRRGAFKVTVWNPPTEAERNAQRLAKLGARVQHRHIRLKHGDPREGTTWPWPWTAGPFSDNDAAHKARYAPHTLTPRDAMELAGIADAYKSLITHPCDSVREQLKNLHVAYELWCEGVLKEPVSDAGRTVHADVRISTGHDEEAPADRDDGQAGGSDSGHARAPEQDAGVLVRD